MLRPELCLCLSVWACLVAGQCNLQSFEVTRNDKATCEKDSINLEDKDSQSICGLRCDCRISHLYCCLGSYCVHVNNSTASIVVTDSAQLRTQTRRKRRSLLLDVLEPDDTTTTETASGCGGGTEAPTTTTTSSRRRK